ncbi:hypothetical protein ACJX0J_028124, partial [Zea mays]
VQDEDAQGTFLLARVVSFIVIKVPGNWKGEMQGDILWHEKLLATIDLVKAHRLLSWTCAVVKFGDLILALAPMDCYLVKNISLLPKIHNKYILIVKYTSFIFGFDVFGVWILIWNKRGTEWNHFDDIHAFLADWVNLTQLLFLTTGFEDVYLFMFSHLLLHLLEGGVGLPSVLTRYIQSLSICEIGSMIGAVEEDIVRFKVHIKSDGMMKQLIW